MPDPAGPSPEALTATLDRVSHRHLLVSRDRIAFARRGVALTLNGIAPGYVTDRIVDLLRSEGIDRTLVDMGESRGIGTRPDGRPWQVAIADPDEPGRIDNTLTIADQAVATSGGYGYRFDHQGRFNHLFDPRTGLSAQRYRSVTVVLPTAAAADALSTAFSLMPLEAIEDGPEDARDRARPSRDGGRWIGSLTRSGEAPQLGVAALPSPLRGGVGGGGRRRGR